MAQCILHFCQSWEKFVQVFDLAEGVMIKPYWRVTLVI